jgi:hypothetical protein
VDTPCGNCWRLGHMWKDCPNPQFCRRCGREGHKMTDCMEATPNANRVQWSQPRPALPGPVAGPAR